MPGWLASLLRSGSEIKREGERLAPAFENKLRYRVSVMLIGITGIIPVLQQLLDQNKGTKYAYLCHPSVQHISKIRLEGIFAMSISTSLPFPPGDCRLRID